MAKGSHGKGVYHRNCATGSALVVLYSSELEHRFEVVLEAGGEIVE